MKKTILALLSVALLGGCGGGDTSDSAQAPASPETAAPAKAPAQDTSDNLLSTQQQALKDAQGVQSILDQDAEKKKKALDNLN